MFRTSLNCDLYKEEKTDREVADIGFGAEYDMISNGEVDHPFVNDFDDSTSWGILVSLVE